LISIAEIKGTFKGKVLLNERLAPYTTFRIGGVADYYLEPIDAKDLLNIIKYLNGKSVPYYVMGNGSNVLISDEGIRGAVFNLEAGFSYLKHEKGMVISGAGAKIAKFVDFCIQNSYAGVEMLAGIPATIGGAVIMNAGAYGGEISTYVDNVTVIKKEVIVTLKKQDCGFIYRNSNLKSTVVIEAVFKLPAGDPEEVSRVRKELLLKRNEQQPVEIPNAGCIFKNPAGSFAAKLIEDCGLKGSAYGGAMVSPKHSNFIVNYNNRATAQDVIELIKIVRQKVKAQTGIWLELEVKLVGFKEVVT
jgi:UDP-N-acetylmuramate dehydrogenase